MKKKKRVIIPNQKFENIKHTERDDNSKLITKKQKTKNKWASFTYVGNEVLGITKLLKET
jgi:hypothetical protein